MKAKIIVLFLLLFKLSYSQSTFNYTVELFTDSVTGMPGLHSYAFGQHGNKWVFIGGRADGLHARQPFNSFPKLQNNTKIYVVDIATKQVWNASVSSLATSIAEQLQSTNMCYYQGADTLYIIGGYAFSETANDHITFPYLTTVNVPGLINAVVAGTPIDGNFKQVTSDAFAVTGGQLGKINTTFYLVGGHKFMGRYNPMGNPTYTQSYTNQIRKFTINNSGSQLSYANYDTVTDPIHLHRRDYNLISQVFNNGNVGYTISSGVFQTNIDLPYLYPVDFDENGYTPVTAFSQYLSNYHSAHVSLFDSLENTNHTLFFGGMSQYYYQNGALVQDSQVPFVKTISLLTRDANNVLQEYQLPVEMPGLEGAGAEFIVNENLPRYDSDIIKLSTINQDTVLLGYIFGGIKSSILNAFGTNQTGLTNASSRFYGVKLIRNQPMGLDKIDGENKYSFTISSISQNNKLTLDFKLLKKKNVAYYVSNKVGQLLVNGDFNTKTGNNSKTIDLPLGVSSQLLYITLVFDDIYYCTKQVFVE
jgi:hypothetical protein